MNINLYNQLVEMFSFITEPLWELYGLYNGYSGTPLLGTILLGLIASTYPGQIIFHLGATTYITSQMRYKSNWFTIIIGLLMGKMASVYLIIGTYFLIDEDWVEVYLEGIRNFSAPFYLLLGIAFLNSINGMKHLTVYKGFLIGFFLSLFMDLKVFSLMDLFTPWILDQPLFVGWILPFFYVLATFTPIFIFSVLSYGFKLDTLLRKNHQKKSVHYFFGITLIVLALNQFFLY